MTTASDLERSDEAEEIRPEDLPSDGLQIRELKKSYGRRMVVKGVDLSLKRGEVVGLLGPNGAGKTTCFYMITGLVSADSGAICMDGEDIISLPMYQRARLGIGYLPQEASIFRGLSVQDNILGVVELVERDKTVQREIVDSLLSELHIEHLRDASAMALSGGERRRVEIARALATRPSFILLDEPFAGIDPLAIADIRELIMFLRNRGIGILITDHNVRETLEITDRASIIYDGEVLFEGSPTEVRANPEVKRLYLGDSFH
ncbi:LPS export ABC transporter ATP-binding protein [Euryhalocaulis caribicus]|uniref:LPS export ABC transporter ATP-binding protein n=1 Tax=Euryhalocaulis caribicus TaxID=1161401 RepID=UPI0003A4A765